MTTEKSTTFVGLKVNTKKCSECLFTKHRIVPLDRMKEVLAACEKGETFFKCHEHDDVMCRGFYDANPNCEPLRITEAMETLMQTSYLKFV